MKKIIPLVFTTILILAFSACSSDEEVADNPRKEVKIVATIGSPADNRTKATLIDDGSGEFETGDKYTLWAHNPVLGVGGTYTYEIGSTTLYWDQISEDGSPIDFMAWYPTYNIHTSTEVYKVAAATEEAKDLLMALPVTVSINNPVVLQFKHVMHKLTIILTSNYYSTGDLNSAVITLRNLKSDAMVDFKQGTVDETRASGTDAYPQKQGATTNFIVAPQTLTEGTEIVDIQIGGKTHSYKVPATLAALESGKVLTLNLNLKYTGTRSLSPASIETESIEIESWNRK